MKIQHDPRVAPVFEKYPENVRPKMDVLRNLIFEAVSEIDGITTISETLKWGEPSYIVAKGSTLRMDWKEKTPHQYAMYFKCTSKLVETFREVYGDLFKYEKNRAIVFHLHDNVPIKELKECIKTTLTYHKVKHLDLLGL